MNINHLLGFPLDFNGNLQRALFEAIHIARLGLKVNFAVSSKVIRNQIIKKSIPEKYQNTANFRVYPLKPLTSNGIFGWRLNNLIALPIGALKIPRSSDKTLMHVHSPTPVTKPFAVSLIKKLKKIPMLVDLHDPWSGNPFSKSPIQLLQTSIMKHVIDNASFIVVAHTALIDLVKKFNKNVPVALIPNGVDTEIFKPKSRCLSLVKKLNLHHQDKIIVFSGHITEEKGLDTLVKVAKIITKKHNNFKFIIIGDGPVRGKIINLVKNLGLNNFFRFTGFVETKVLSDYYSLADLCVCPYKPLAHYDVMKIETPLKVVQYLSMGKPVIMSKVSEENVVKWSNGGLLVDPLNPQIIADIIINLIKDEKLRKKMGKNGRNYVEKNLDWKKIAKKLVKIYASIN